MDWQTNDVEVESAIEQLRAKALSGIYGTTGTAWEARAKVNRLAGLLRIALLTPPDPPVSPAPPEPEK